MSFLLVLLLLVIPGYGVSTSQNESKPDTLVQDCRNSTGHRIHTLGLHGLVHTREEVVRRELAHIESGLFSLEVAEAEKLRLEDLDIFSSVEIHCQDSAGVVMLEYRFREMPPYIPFISMLKTDQDGWSAGPALASLNFLGRDMRIELHSRFGGTTEFLVSLSSPWIGVFPVEYDIFASRVNSFNPLDEFREESWRLGWEFLYRFSPAWGFLLGGEAFYIESDLPEVLLNPSGDFVPRLGAGLVWDTRDRRLHAERGLYREIRVTQSGGFLGGPADFQEILADMRVYHPLSSRVKLHVAGLYQYRLGELGRDLGLYDDFHVGGANTLRGYAVGALRGKNEVLITAEGRVTVWPRTAFRIWKINGYFAVEGVLGLEAAGVWDEKTVLPTKQHPAGYAGIHLLLAGVDRIRLELGSKSAKAEVKFDVGVWEKPQAQRFRTR